MLQPHKIIHGQHASGLVVEEGVADAIDGHQEENTPPGNEQHCPEPQFPFAAQTLAPGGSTRGRRTRTASSFRMETAAQTLSRSVFLFLAMAIDYHNYADASSLIGA